MTNHFHLLLEVPPPPSDVEFGLDEEELIHRLGGLYSRAYVNGVKNELATARLIADGKREGFSDLSKAQQKKELAYGKSEVAAIFQRYTRRMNDLSEFMRALLQRYTRWFNTRHGVRGTLWEDRRILVAGASEQTEECSDGRNRIHRKGMSKARTEKELARLEKEQTRDLRISKVVRCKVRNFRDGAVLGSRKFVNEFFESQRESFSKKRKDGARKPRGSLKDLAGEIWSLRDLKDG